MICRFHAIKKPFIYFDPGAEAAKEAKAEKPAEKPKTPAEIADEARQALDYAKSEKERIETAFQDINTGKFKGPESLPPKIREQYEALKKTITELEGKITVARAKILEETLRRVRDISAGLAGAAKEYEKETAGSPLAALYMPSEFKPVPKEPDVSPAKVQGGIKEQVAAAAKPVESKEAMSDRLLNQVIEKAKNGGDSVTPEEATALRKEISGAAYFFTGADGKEYTLELSKDKKFVRISGEREPGHGVKEATFVQILALEAGGKGEPKFELKTAQELNAQKIETNKTEFGKQLAWLQSDEAPLGSKVIISTREFTRTNHETKAEEKVVASHIVVKGVNGLRLSTYEMVNDGTPKEVSGSPFDQEAALSLVAAEDKILAVEGSKAERVAELRAKLGSLADQLVAYMVLEGTEGKGPKFQTTLAEMKKIIDQHNVGRWSYRESSMGLTVKLANREITIEDRKTKNPAFKNKEETPDVPQYAVKAGPIRLDEVKAA